MNKAKKTLKDAGIKARKDNRDRKDRIKEYERRGSLPLPELLIPIRDPSINLIVIKQASLL
jgi:hypothetical protein